MAVECRHCGRSLARSRDGKVPMHDYPPPCRAVCPGSGHQPRRRGAALHKDDPSQEERDFVYEARVELKLYGFAYVKNVANMRHKLSGELSGEMPCPLCQQPLKYSISGINGHCMARCSTEDCVTAIE